MGLNWWKSRKTTEEHDPNKFEDIEMNSETAKQSMGWTLYEKKKKKNTWTNKCYFSKSPRNRWKFKKKRKKENNKQINLETVRMKYDPH